MLLKVASLFIILVNLVGCNSKNGDVFGNADKLENFAILSCEDNFEFSSPGADLSPSGLAQNINQDWELVEVYRNSANDPVWFAGSIQAESTSGNYKIELKSLKGCSTRRGYYDLNYYNSFNVPKKISRLDQSVKEVATINYSLDRYSEDLSLRLSVSKNTSDKKNAFSNLESNETLQLRINNKNQLEALITKTLKPLYSYEREGQVRIKLVYNLVAAEPVAPPVESKPAPVKPVNPAPNPGDTSAESCTSHLELQELKYSKCLNAYSSSYCFNQIWNDFAKSSPACSKTKSSINFCYKICEAAPHSASYCFNVCK